MKSLFFFKTRKAHVTYLAISHALTSQPLLGIQPTPRCDLVDEYTDKKWTYGFSSTTS